MRKKREKKPLDPVKQFREWMKNTLRRAFFRYWERTKALQAARVDRGLYKCASCVKVSPIKGHHIDHIEPVVDPKVGFVDWQTYISRLFCPASNLQLLCKECHTVKTALEREERKKHRTGQYALGKKMPEETKEKISKASKGRSPSNLADIQQQRRTPIVATNAVTGEVREFESNTDAARELGVLTGNISIICGRKTKRKKSHGWIFEYKKKEKEVTAEDLDEWAKRFPNQETR